MPKKNKSLYDDIVVVPSPLSENDKRLNKLFVDMENSSLETLENAARQIITLTTTLIAAFFSLLAFKDAPAYLNFYEIKGLGILALTAFIFALFSALFTVSPKRYDFPRANLTAKYKILGEMLTRKQMAIRWALRTFGVGVFFMLLAIFDILIFRI